MKKIKNKFIIIIIFIILFILWIEIYNNIFQWNKDSYVVLKQWQWLVNNSILKLNTNFKISSWAVIKTIGEQSLAIVKWWDWSITRMWGNSEIVVKQAQIEPDLLDIKIIFKLNKWKTWSNVVSFIGWDSYFYQEFADTTAAVRWTTFEVNLEKNYLYVLSHEVQLIKNDNKKIIWENKAFDIQKFNFIDLFNFIAKYKDKIWININKKLDINFYDLLRKKINIKELKTIDINNIKKLTLKEKEKLYNELKSQYQKINFLNPNDELYYSKLKLKQTLIKLAPSKEKTDLLNSSLYDFTDIINFKKYNYLKENLLTFVENIWYFKNLDINFKEYFQNDIIKKIKIPSWLEKEFNENFEILKNNLKLSNITLDTSKIVDFIDYSKQELLNWLQQTWIIEQIKKFFKNKF